jgi:hypothetical protein
VRGALQALPALGECDDAENVWLDGAAITAQLLAPGGEAAALA